MPIQEGQADAPLYPDDLLPKIQQILAILADLDRRYETDRYHLENWSGPTAIKESLLADLEQCHRANRERYEGCLEELRLSVRTHIEGLRLTRAAVEPAPSMRTKHECETETGFPGRQS